MTNTITPESITPAYLESLCIWSAPRLTRTPKGDKMVRTATPGGKFWAAWRVGEEVKQVMRDLGISVKPGSNNEWIVNWYAAPEAIVPAIAALPAATPAPNGFVWSDEQEAIFTWFRTGTGALVVRARAGTGKTTTIKQAFNYTRDDRMLYAVFGKKNQREASEAIFDPRVEIKTLHSVGLFFIQQVWPGVKPDKFVESERVEKIVGEQTAKEIKTQVRKLVGFAKNCLISATMKDLIDLAEERDIQCEQFEDEANGGWDRVKLAHHAMLVLELSRERDPQGRISFDDMVWLPVRQNWVRAWYDLIVVDEAQDMNLPQLTMARLAVKSGGRICVVGDDRQAIYHFRGAASDGLDMMKTVLKAQELGLTVTRRCPKKVVALAVPLVPDYRAAESAPEGFVEQVDVSTITAIVKIGDAILSRSNSPLMPLCLSLLRKGTPARIEGRDVGQALVEIVEKLNARTVPQFITKIEVWREKQIHRFENTPKLEEKAQQINDQADTLIAIAEGASSVHEIENRLNTLFQDTDKGAKPAVVLSTVHKAKGLEWEKVFIMRETFNRKRPASAPPLSEAAEAARAREEANVYYVALTRTKMTLVMATGKIS